MVRKGDKELLDKMRLAVATGRTDALARWKLVEKSIAAEQPNQVDHLPPTGGWASKYRGS